MFTDPPQFLRCILIFIVPLQFGCMQELSELTTTVNSHLNRFATQKDTSIYRNQPVLAELKCLAAYADAAAGDVTRIKKTRNNYSIGFAVASGLVATASSIAAAVLASQQSSTNSTTTGWA
jgi:hypothetical protein